MSEDLPIPFESPKRKKHGGRAKGRRNKASYLLKQAQHDIYEMYGVEAFDPVVFLLTTAANPSLEMELRIVAASKAAPYIHATAKPMVIEPKESKRDVDVERLMAQAAKDLLIENVVPVMKDEFYEEAGVEAPDDDDTEK
jgi:hypothetical protein